MSVRDRLSARVAGLAIAVIALFLPVVASAEGRPQLVRVRGDVEKLDGLALTVKSRESAPVKIDLADNYAVSLEVKADLASIKPGDYIATAALVEPGGMLKAQMVMIFPEALRGTGEGHFPWDLTPDSTMTNATVADVVTKVDNRTLTLKYKGGEKTVEVPLSVPVVTLKPGTREMLVPGAHIFIVAAKQPDASLKAGRVTVGADGMVPPN
jgi:hypothetical protein